LLHLATSIQERALFTHDSLDEVRLFRLARSMGWSDQQRDSAAV
jgi:hypothetical protein